MPRLFVALDLPADVKKQLLALQDESLKGVRWTTDAQMHFTLHFLGNVDDTQAEAIHAALQTVQGESFDMHIKGVGHFPPRGKPRILWAGVEPHPALMTLHQSIGEALKPTGYQPESRPYSPHITLGRIKKPLQSPLDAFFAQTLDVTPFAITHFYLYSSTLTRQGAVYRHEHAYPLD